MSGSASRAVSLSEPNSPRIASSRPGPPPDLRIDGYLGGRKAATTLMTADTVPGLLTELHENGATVVIAAYDEAVAARLPRRIELAAASSPARPRPPPRSGRTIRAGAPPDTATGN